MRVQINEDWVVIPSSIDEITLKQRIDFQEQHGNLLIQMAESINSIEDEFERELESTQFQFEKMFRTFSFFSGVSLEVLKESEFIDKIAAIYYANLAGLLEQEEAFEPKTSFIWKDAEWVLASPELKHGDKMTFGELIDSKQMIQNMVNLGKNRWECLLPLCAIFLRRKDEAYQESFLYDGSERLELMESLPLDIALQVAFFLKVSLSIYTDTFQFFTNLESSKTENI